MQMGKVSSVMSHDNEPTFLALNYQYRIDRICVDNNCMTILNGQNSIIRFNIKNRLVVCYLIFR